VCPFPREKEDPMDPHSTMITALDDLTADGITAEAKRVGPGHYAVTSPDEVLDNVEQALRDSLVGRGVDHSIANSGAVISVVIHGGRS
jgi:hypothetical protein